MAVPGTCSVAAFPSRHVVAGACPPARANPARVQYQGGALMGDKAKGKGKQLKKPKTDAKDKKSK